MPRPTTISQEDQIRFADAYLKYGSFDKTARALQVPRWKVVKSYYRLQGRCDCGKELTTDNLTCPTCHDRANKTRKDLAGRRRQAGLCVSCGALRSPHSKTYCETHLQCNRDQQKYKRQCRKDNHLCVVCGNPLDDNSIRYCSRCLPGVSGGKKSYKDKTKCDGFYGAVLQRDNYKCVICGNAEPRLEVHHISDTNSMDTLVTLCLRCHHTITALSHCPDTPKLLSFFYQHTV